MREPVAKPTLTRLCPPCTKKLPDILDENYSHPTSVLRICDECMFISLFVQNSEISALPGMSKMGEEPKESKGQEEQIKNDGQVETVEKALEAERRRSEEYLTQLKYARADIENLMKRFNRQLEDAKLYANERVIVQLLDVVDELEMAVKSATLSGCEENMVQGVKMTLKKLMKILEGEEVHPIESVGASFDPDKHEAVARIEKEGVEGCTVIEEVRRGYIMRGKVIRPSIVKVVVPSSQSQKEPEGDELK